MERRTVLAFGLMLIVAILPSILFSPQRPVPGGTDGVLDTGSAFMDTLAVREIDSGFAAEEPAVSLPPAVDSGESVRPPTPEREVVVRSDLFELVFTSRGARLVSVTLTDYRSFAPGDSGRAQLLPPASQFLQLGLLFGSDTVELADWTFEPSADEVVVNGGPATLSWTGRRGSLTVTIDYEFTPGRYLFDVSGSVQGVDGSNLVLVGLGPGIDQIEADSVDNYRSFAVVTKADKTESLKFSSLDPGELRALDGPFEWVAVKSKYFVTAVMTVAEGQPQLGGIMARGGPRFGKQAAQTDVVATLPAPGGAFSLSAYIGPQEFRRLSAIGNDFRDINPYGWILRPIIRPFASLIVIVLLWLHETLSLGYGWVLIIFGLAVRILLWPLNQKAMRSSVAMQAIQPEIKALQERHKSDPQKLQQEMMKLYKEHQVNPLGGCLPLLLPMPVLFALFFVFRETIEFRGVPFLWLPDLSRADPLFIIPILMGLSMFAVTKIGQRGVPPNPQAKMLLFFMPAFLTFIFLRLSAGLNLYYAVSNIASIPQQWLISQQRMKRGAVKGKAS